MNKWIAIPVTAVLAVALIVVGVFLWLQTDKLGEARDDIAALEDNVATLEGNVADLEGELAATQSELADTESELADTESELADTESELADTESELATTQSNLAATRSDLADTESELADTESELADTESELADTASDLATALDQVSQLEDFKTELTSLWTSSLKKIELGNQVIRYLALFYDRDATEQESVDMFKSFDALVNAIGDSELSLCWKMAWSTGARAQSESEGELWLSWDGFVEFLDRLITIIEEDIEAMELQLAE